LHWRSGGADAARGCGENLFHSAVGGIGIGADGLLFDFAGAEDIGNTDVATQRQRYHRGAASGRASQGAEDVLPRIADTSAARYCAAPTKRAGSHAGDRLGFAGSGAAILESIEIVLAGGESGWGGDAGFFAGADDACFDAGGSAGADWDYGRVGENFGGDRGCGRYYGGFGSGVVVRVRKK